jgi:hypothetical protein
LDAGLFPYTKEISPLVQKSFFYYRAQWDERSYSQLHQRYWGYDYSIGAKISPPRYWSIWEDILKEYQEDTGNLYNLEATPAEGTTYRFAKEDKKQLAGNIIQAGTD